MTVGGLRESPPYTVIMVDPTPEDDDIRYRSVPGRGVSTKRSISISSPLDLNIEFHRLKETKGIDTVLLWVCILDGGVPLVWPVPDAATYDDVLVRIWYAMPEPAPNMRYPIHIGDHWSTT